MSPDMGDKGALALMGMYGSDSEDEGCNDANGAHDRAPPGETRGAHGGHDSDSEEGVDILGAIAAATENAADGRSPAKQQNGEDEGTTAEPAAEAEPPEEPMEEEAPVPRRQCVSIPAKFMEGVEILAAPEGEVAPETLVRLDCVSPALRWLRLSLTCVCLFLRRTLSESASRRCGRGPE